MDYILVPVQSNTLQEDGHIITTINTGVRLRLTQEEHKRRFVLEDILPDIEDFIAEATTDYIGKTWFDPSKKRESIRQDDPAGGGTTTPTKTRNQRYTEYSLPSESGVHDPSSFICNRSPPPTKPSLQIRSTTRLHPRHHGHWIPKNSPPTTIQTTSQVTRRTQRNLYGISI